MSERRDGRGQLVLGLPRIQDAQRRGSSLGAHLGTRPGSPSPTSRRRPPPPRPGGGSRAPGRSAPTPPPALSPSAARACTHFTRAGDRRAVDAQAAHAVGGRASRQADGRLWRQLHGLETTPPRSGAVSFLLSPRVTALGTNGRRGQACGRGGACATPPCTPLSPSPPPSVATRRGP